MGKFENRRVIRFSYKNRLYWRRNIPGEGDKERTMLAYQVSKQIVQGQFPLNRDLAFELAALMAQVCRVVGLILHRTVGSRVKGG